MEIFCGDSHTRQFRTTLAGNYLFNIFTGATIKGLMSESSKIEHGTVVRHIVNLPFRHQTSNLFLMFGGVDYDATFYRSLCSEKRFDVADFLKQRVDVYNSFLSLLLQDIGTSGRFSSICVLAPHATPLRDDVFVAATAQMSDVRPSLLERAGGRIDISHAARNRRIISHNDYLEAHLIRHELIRFHRIDKNMVDEDGNFREQFYPTDRMDHHANQAATLAVWAEKLQVQIPRFKRLLNPDRMDQLTVH